MVIEATMCSVYSRDPFPVDLAYVKGPAGACEFILTYHSTADPVLPTHGRIIVVPDGTVPGLVMALLFAGYAVSLKDIELAPEA